MHLPKKLFIFISEKYKKITMKGISPMIAIVLLIAFVVAIGGILSVWLTGLTTTQTGVVGTAAEKQVKCAASVLDITEVTSILGNSNGDLLNVTVKYTTGSEDLYYFNITLVDSGRTSTTVTPKIGHNFNKSFVFSPGDMHVFNINTSCTAGTSCPGQDPVEAAGADLSGGLQSVRVTAKCQDDYPVIDECKAGEACMK
jgi:flagellin-like protein